MYNKLIYEQTYTLKWEHLAVLLDMYNPMIAKLPENAIADELIDAEYVEYDSEKKVFRLSSNYYMLMDCFLGASAAVNIEAPVLSKMQASLALYYLKNNRHMLVLIHENDPERMAEIAISRKNAPAVLLYEQLSKDFKSASALQRAEAYGAEDPPPQYKADFDKAKKEGSLFRVTLLDQAPNAADVENAAVAVFAAYKSTDDRIWLTAMRQKLISKRMPVIIQKLSYPDYTKQLHTFFELFEKTMKK